MNRWKLAVPVVASLATVFGTGCAEEVAVRPPARPQVVVQGPTVVRERVVVEEGPPAEVIVQTAPPVERIEVVPAPPSLEHLWIKGNWHWDGHEWVWRSGHYEVRRVGLHWVQAHYDQRGPAIVYVGGHWAR